MEICRISLPHKSGYGVPAIVIIPQKPLGGVVLVHGYGGCKEEQMGFAWRIAENGFAVCIIDLCGHGENAKTLNSDMLAEVATAIEYCRQFGKVVAIGHSLGGRLSLLSTADFAVGISPAMDAEYSKATRDILATMRSYRVKEESFEFFLEILRTLPEWRPDERKPVLMVYGTRDVPEIINTCRNFKTKGTPVIEINEALHFDIYLQEQTFRIVAKQLRLWFNIGSLKS